MENLEILVSAVNLSDKFEKLIDRETDIRITAHQYLMLEFLDHYKLPNVRRIAKEFHINNRSIMEISLASLVEIDIIFCPIEKVHSNDRQYQLTGYGEKFLQTCRGIITSL